MPVPILYYWPIEYYSFFCYYKWHYDGNTWINLLPISIYFLKFLEVKLNKGV